MYHQGIWTRGGEESNRNSNSNSNNAKKQSPADKEDGAMERFHNHELQLQNKSNESSNCGRGGTNGPQVECPTLKSNLKKRTTVDDNQQRIEKRKVSWLDAHGKDIAHVQEFEPSVSEDGELGGVRNSCVCAIQ
ncbi:hypothetical protein F2P56_027187 [Juglans regia]|uniref:Uncharacterized protein n=2 Tax=Juglans regia TaxID=51240 RepID=A0A833U6E9_JUGRE|nr:uncharacterized protein LOC108995885 [Juglans regia]KAF5452157.1 hypothetical protein F2P56_027187 [Juglans regia]